MYKLTAVIVFAAAIFATSPALAEQDCTMADDDRAWLADAVDEWRVAQREDLHLGGRELPTIYAVDAACTYVLPKGDMAAATATVHPEGQVELPQIGLVPLGPISFAYSGTDFVMSLPSIWRSSGVKSALGLERLMTGVLLHEIAHTQQARMMELVEPLAKAKGIEKELSDDLIQERFAKVSGYEAAFRAETELLFAAAAAPDVAGARGLAAHALHMMSERRGRWLAGDHAHFTVFDDVFLTMEGTGQWLMYRYFRRPSGGSADVATALIETRRGSKWWSQDEGLALILVLDRLLPDWRERSFRDPDGRAANLLAAAVGAAE